MMMRIMRSAFGEERILGEEFPNETRQKVEAQRQEALSKLTEIQRYLLEKMRVKPKESSMTNRVLDMNPNGYFEMAFTVRGAAFSPATARLLERVEKEEKPSICKIVSQGLAKSDPRYIDKVVFMVRDPRAVAKSQERLGRQNPMDPERAPQRNGKPILIRSVGMYNQVTVAAARWIVNHPDIPVHVVNYDALLDNPLPVIASIAEFLGEGDFSRAHELIDTSLRRSEPEAVDEGEDALFAMALHGHLLVGRFDRVLETAKARAEYLRANPPAPKQWHCPRLKQTVVENICRLCRSHELTTRNLRETAKKKKIKWEGEPCPYECGIMGDAGITVAESIAQNHWLALGG
jgi:hypothetical protein